MGASGSEVFEGAQFELGFCAESTTRARMWRWRSVVHVSTACAPARGLARRAWLVGRTSGTTLSERRGRMRRARVGVRTWSPAEHAWPPKRSNHAGRQS